TPLVLRLIVLQGPRGIIYLVTNVLSTKALSNRQTAKFYRLRWGVEIFHADYDEKDNLYRGARWPYSSRACVVEAGALVPAMQALKFRRNLMRSAKEGVVPPRAQRGPISMSC
ncbi:MAG: hypothetical protein ABSH20_30715, partial [Tepidisphaeraceae bacterium]